MWVIAPTRADVSEQLLADACLADEACPGNRHVRRGNAPDGRLRVPRRSGAPVGAGAAAVMPGRRSSPSTGKRNLTVRQRLVPPCAYAIMTLLLPFKASGLTVWALESQSPVFESQLDKYTVNIQLSVSNFMITCGHFQGFSRAQGVDSILPGNGPATRHGRPGIPTLSPRCTQILRAFAQVIHMFVHREAWLAEAPIEKLPAQTTRRSEHGRR